MKLYLQFAASLLALMLLAADARCEPVPDSPPALKTAQAVNAKYYLSLPHGWRSDKTWPILVTIDGSGHNFLSNCQTFSRARGDRPFIIVTPCVTSNGNDPADAIAVLAIVREVQQASLGQAKFFLTGFSAGGHLAWQFIFNHPELLAGAAPAAANYRGRGVTTVSDAPERSQLPIHAFQGDKDPFLNALNEQWDDASTLARNHGYQHIVRTMVPGAGHNPFAAQVMDFCSAVLADSTTRRNAGSPASAPPSFNRIVIDPRVENSSHKPKVFDKFSKDGYNDIGTLDSDGFKLYRYSEHWKPYVIFPLKTPGDYEDGTTADINGDGWNDIILGGWGNRTLWAENPAGHGKDPYTTIWTVHLVDSTRFSHEVCAADMNHDGKCDIVTTSGIYFQGATPNTWTFVNIGRGGQGTHIGNVLHNGDGYNDVIAVYQVNGHNQIAWFENPGHSGGSPIKGHWVVHIIDPNPGGAEGANKDMDEMAFAFGDINHDGRPDVIAASMGEGPDASNDQHQVGDGLVWYEAPTDPHNGIWIKHTIDSTAGWVHASSIQLADFDGDGSTDVCYAEQDQSGPTPTCGKGRTDGIPSPRLVICYNGNGNGSAWTEQVLSQRPDDAAGGFNSKVGLIGKDRLPSIVTSLHGWCSDHNPILLWRNTARSDRSRASSSRK